MTTPFDPDDSLAALLADYAAPVADDGFADRVLAEARRRRRVDRWRAWLSGAAGCGALLALAAIAAALLPALPEVSVSTSALEQILSAGSTLPLVAFAAIAGWVLLDGELA